MRRTHECSQAIWVRAGHGYTRAIHGADFTARAQRRQTVGQKLTWLGLHHATLTRIIKQALRFLFGRREKYLIWHAAGACFLYLRVSRHTFCLFLFLVAPSCLRANQETGESHERSFVAPLPLSGSPIIATFKGLDARTNSTLHTFILLFIFIQNDCRSFVFVLLFCFFCFFLSAWQLYRHRKSGENSCQTDFACNRLYKWRHKWGGNHSNLWLV